MTKDQPKQDHKPARERRDDHEKANARSVEKGTTEGSAKGGGPRNSDAVKAADNAPQPGATDSKRNKIPTHKLPVKKEDVVPATVVARRKLREIGELIHVPPGLEDAELQARIQRALDLYESVDPKDGVEGMLTTQMVGTHLAAQDCLRRAAGDQISPERRSDELKHAQKLMSLFVQQMGALDKHRGKGQQKMTVEYIHVSDGGQAFVGNVEPMSSVGNSRHPGTSDNRATDDDAELQKARPAQIEQKHVVPMPEIRVRHREPTKND